MSLQRFENIKTVTNDNKHNSLERSCRDARKRNVVHSVEEFSILARRKAVRGILDMSTSHVVAGFPGSYIFYNFSLGISIA